MIKRGISVFLVYILLVPQIFTTSVSAAEKKEKNLGEKYEKKVIASMSRERLASGRVNLTDNDEKLSEEELKLLEEGYKGKETYEVLVPKTDSNYEVTLSYEDGSYTYEESANTYDEAVEKAKVKEETLEKSRNSQIVVPTVIDNSGAVVYATLSIARSWKDGKKSAGTSLSYIYSNQGLTNEYTYINDNYLSEMPIVEDRANETKVLIAGYEGWMNKNINRTAKGYNGPNSDIIIQPITNVTTPCYYTVDNGFLVHHISVKMDGGSTYPYTIGVAPSYLRSGIRYYSYDGNYFYDGSQGTATGLSNLTRDLQSGSHGRAVNSNNPFYNYYSYLPFRTKTSYSAQDLDRYINANTQGNSRLRGLGQAFINAQNTYGVNALLALGIAMNESGKGTSDFALNRNNLFGLHATDDNTSQNASYYNRPDDCINEFARNYISRGYADPGNWTFYGGYLGNKKYGANVQYASDPYWSEKAMSYVIEAERYISGGNVNNMKDYNYYKLLMYTGTSNVVTSEGNTLYPVRSYIGQDSSNIGAVVACTGNERGSSYEIYPDRTSYIGTGRFNGDYNWGIKGYVNKNTVTAISTGKNLYVAEDLNMDGKVNSLDLALLAGSYNKTKSSSGWNSKYDLNGDAIIDIYDIVRIARKL